MNNRHFEKLRRFLNLSDGDNPALKKQLDDVVVRKHKNRFGVKLIVLFLRPLYYHKVLGRENAAGYEEGSLVLVCNHGGAVRPGGHQPVRAHQLPALGHQQHDGEGRDRPLRLRKHLVRQQWLRIASKCP
jgi:hypothetical protein